MNAPRPKPRELPVNCERLVTTLLDLLAVPSPAGFTDNVVRLVCSKLDRLGFPYELTRRGAIRVNLSGLQYSPDRALAAHIDTLGAQVKALKPNGRLELVMIGHWSARFAEGARATIFTDTDRFRGTILPMKASGHTFGPEIDKQPSDWKNLELRVDIRSDSAADLEAHGIAVGDIVAIDPQPEVTDTGFVVSRHLDDKAGAACLLEMLEGLAEVKPDLPVDCHVLFTISEEVGSGASAVLHGDVAELVAIDNGTTAPGQNSDEYSVTVGMGDMTGPFDWHLTRYLLGMAQACGIPHRRDVFRYYRCDAASAVEAGNDIRTALLTFGVDASHGWERIHTDALVSLTRLIGLYVQSPPAVARDHQALGPIEGFPVTAPKHRPSRKRRVEPTS